MQKQVTFCDQCNEEKMHENGWWVLEVEIPPSHSAVRYTVYAKGFEPDRAQEGSELRDLCSEECLQRMEGEIREQMRK